MAATHKRKIEKSADTAENALKRHKKKNLTEHSDNASIKSEGSIGAMFESKRRVEKEGQDEDEKESKEKEEENESKEEKKKVAKGDVKAKTARTMTKSTEGARKRKHRCEYNSCGKWFRTPSELKRHYRSHTKKEKPFVCGIDGCTKSYSWRDSLKRHHRSHIGDTKKELSPVPERVQHAKGATHSTVRQDGYKRRAGCEGQPGHEGLESGAVCAISPGKISKNEEEKISNDQDQPTKCIRRICQSKVMYGTEWKQPVHCFKHRQPGEVDVMSQRCEECTKRPSFGYEGGKAVRCVDHKLDGQENCVSKRCEKKGCKIQPSFGYEGGKAVRCFAHKLEGQENVVNKQCEEKGCKIWPSFGHEWGKAVRCFAHKLDGQEDVVNTRCEEKGCTTQPSFGHEWRKAVRCFAHKLDGQENVVNTRCEEKGCTTHPVFGYEGGKAVRCVAHKLDGQENVVNKRCEVRGCEKSAQTKNGDRVYCTIHHPDYIPAKNGYSKMGCKFLDQLRKELSCDIKHVHYDLSTKRLTGNEKKISGTQFRVDGFVEKGKITSLPSISITKPIIFEFYGDLWHGNPEKYHPDAVSHFGARFGELYNATMERLEEIRTLGYNAVYIWEADFKTWSEQVGKSLLSYCTIVPSL